jgi:hypothetical protein
LLKNNYKNKEQCETSGNEDMGPIYGSITFKFFPHPIANRYGSDPQQQEDKHKQDSEDGFGKRGPGIVTEHKNPENSSQAPEKDQGNDPGHQKTGDSKQQCIQVSLFHGASRWGT